MRWLTECGLITVMAAAMVPATMTQLPSSSSHPEIGLACSTFVHIQAHEDPIVQLFTVMEDSDRDKIGTNEPGGTKGDPQAVVDSALADHSIWRSEREGFEPPLRLPADRISNAAPSATRTPLHFLDCGSAVRIWKIRAVCNRRGMNGLHSFAAKQSRDWKEKNSVAAAGAGRVTFRSHLYPCRAFLGKSLGVWRDSVASSDSAGVSLSTACEFGVRLVSFRRT